MMKLRLTAVLLLAASLISACKSAPPPAASAASKPAEPDAGLQPAAPVDPNTAGSIKGVVDFTGKAPARVNIDMAMDPACALAEDKNLSEPVIVNNGKLANVYVYIKTGAPPSLALPTDAPAIMNQRGCRYVPHVIAVQQGGLVQFRNGDPTMHNIHTLPTQAGNSAVDVSETPMGPPDSERYSAVETMIPVRCNNHPWMQAYINVAPNPFFDVSDKDGTFSIPNLPPGTYTLAAVHEKYGEKDIQITVSTKATTKATFTFSAK